MYQSNLINDYLDTLFLCYSNLKDFLLFTSLVSRYFLSKIFLRKLVLKLTDNEY